MMVWGCFTVQGIGNLVRIEDILNAYLYINILKDDLPGTFDWYALGKAILCSGTIITRSTQPRSPRNGSQTRASRFWHSLCSRQTSIPLKSSGSGSSLDYPTTRHRRRTSMGFGACPECLERVYQRRMHQAGRKHASAYFYCDFSQGWLY